ncbi:MAG: lysylphosphatidylglycerol synthase transmembrane domain-containing protein [Smithella sp.]|nr:lysylphosphatidylglycerol synthase transmembrane domain-containing protein [Smithella sp.]
MNLQNPQKFNLQAISIIRTLFRVILTWAATLVILAFIFSRIHPADVLALLKKADIGYLSLGILFSLLAHVFFSLARYQNMIRLVGGRLSWGEAMMLRMGCNAVKGVLPFKTGELAMVAYMKKMHHLSYPRGFFSVLFGNVFSLIVLLLFFSAGGIFYFSNRHQSIIFALTFMLFFLVLILLSFRRMPPSVAGFLKKHFRLPEDLASFMEIYDPATMKNIFFHSLGIEGSKLLIIFTVLKSLQIDISFDALLLWGSATILAAYLPVTYWGLGVREATVLFLFADYATPDKLLAGGLLITFVDSVLPVLLGLFFIKPFLDNLFSGKKAGTNTIDR